MHLGFRIEIFTTELKLQQQTGGNYKQACYFAVSRQLPKTVGCFVARENPTGTLGPHEW